MSSSAPVITGVDFVCVPTRDYEAAAAFYGDVLGLPFSKRWGSMPAGEFETGNVTLVVWEPEAFGSTFRPRADPLALRVDDVEVARAALESRGVEFEGDIIDSGSCHQLMFRDPDGNLLDLHHKYAQPAAE